MRQQLDRCPHVQSHWVPRTNTWRTGRIRTSHSMRDAGVLCCTSVQAESSHYCVTRLLRAGKRASPRSRYSRRDACAGSAWNRSWALTRRWRGSGPPRCVALDFAGGPPWDRARGGCALYWRSHRRDVRSRALRGSRVRSGISGHCGRRALRIWTRIHPSHHSPSLPSPSLRSVRSSS